MTRRFSLLAVLCLGLLSHPAWGQPDPTTSVVPPYMRVIPRGGEAPDVGILYSVTVNDAFGVPIPNIQVLLDFSGCPHVQPASEQTFPGVVVVSCDPPILAAFTNLDGVANFVILGSVVSRGAAGTGAGCVAVSAGAFVPLGTASPAAFDADGVNGLTANDLFLFLCDFGSGLYWARSDYSGDGIISAMDVSAWIGSYFATNLAASQGGETAVRCDGLPTTVVNPAAGGLLKLAWNACAADGGAPTRTFACAVNTGAEILEASFVAPPGVDALTGFEAVVEVIGDAGEVLAPWWDFGGCRPTALSVAIDYPEGPGGCPLTGGIPGTSGVVFGAPSPGAETNRGRIRILGAFNTSPPALTAGQEYSLFRISVRHNLTAGAGACAGCAEPVALLFNQLRLTQPPMLPAGCGSPPGPGAEPTVLTGDFIIRGNDTYDDWIAYWQGVPSGLPAVGVLPPLTPAARIDLRCSNPARDGSRIELDLPRTLRCHLAMYDIAGRQRRVLVNDELQPGTRAITWNGRDDDGNPLSSGYYVLRLTTEDGTVSRSLVHLR